MYWYMNAPKLEAHNAGNGNTALNCGLDEFSKPMCLANLFTAAELKSPYSDIIDLFHMTPSAP